MSALLVNAGARTRRFAQHLTNPSFGAPGSSIGAGIFRHSLPRREMSTLPQVQLAPVGWS